MSKRIAFAVCSALVVAGCGDTITESGNLETSEIYAEIVASETGGGDATVQTRLRKGAADSTKFVEPGPGDQLNYFLGGERKSPSRRTEAQANDWFSADFADVEDNASLRVALERNDFQSAPNSKATIPNSFSIEATPDDDRLSRSEEVSIELDNRAASAITRVEVQGLCFEETYTKTFDSKSVTFPGGTFEAEESDAECTTDFNVIRERKGTLDSKLAGGSIRAERIRHVTVTSTP